MNMTKPHAESVNSSGKVLLISLGEAIPMYSKAALKPQNLERQASKRTPRAIWTRQSGHIRPERYSTYPLTVDLKQ